jgi:hypothetical protein
MTLLERARTAILGRRIPPPPDLPPDSVPEGVVLREGWLVPWVGGVLGRMGEPAAAVTLRRTIIVRPAYPITPALVAHELTHVRQWRDDRLFPVRYALASLRHGYDANPYEIEARQVEASIPRTPPSEELA